MKPPSDANLAYALGSGTNIKRDKKGFIDELAKTGLFDEPDENQVVEMREFIKDLINLVSRYQDSVHPAFLYEQIGANGVLGCVAVYRKAVEVADLKLADEVILDTVIRQIRELSLENL